jgi:hypothetical protein
VDLESFRRLLTPAGQAAIHAAAALEPNEADFLALFTRLSRQFPPELARAALETAILRREGQAKFPQSGEMYFTRPALEQATSFAISSYRAQRYTAFPWAADLGCSIGGDSLALAAVAPVVGIDLDPLRLELARANLEAAGLTGRALLLRGDLRQLLPLGAGNGLALFFDPARRTASGRVYSIRDYQPPLSVIHGWLEHFPALGVKISPGVKWDEIRAYPAEVEFISLNGDLKEAVLWFGNLKSARRRATLLPEAASLSVADDQPLEALEISEPGEYIYEPDPAILRAGLVEALGKQLGARQLDPDIAYLTADRQLATPFARSWQVEEWFPFQLKQLRQALRQRRVGQVTIKKRGSPLEPETLIRQLRLQGDQQQVVFLTHLRGRPIAVLARENLSLPAPGQ